MTPEARFKELMKVPRCDLALDVLGLETKLGWARDCLVRIEATISQTFDDAADAARGGKCKYDKLTDCLLKGLRLSKSLVEEMDWDELPFDPGPQPKEEYDEF